MKSEIFIQSRKEHVETQKQVFKDLLEDLLPKMLRKSNRKEWLTTKDLKEDFGISYQSQQYYRDEGKIPFYQEGRKIWYKTSEIEDEFLGERKIEAKK